MPCDAEAIANFFIERAHAEAGSSVDHDLTQMKLQKLVYFTHGWYLAMRGQPLLNEPIKAWRWGPVVLSLRREFIDLGAEPINRKAVNVSAVNGELEVVEPSVDDYFDTDEADYVRWLLDLVWTSYRDKTASHLMRQTHAVGGPWHRVTQLFEEGLPSDVDIPNDLIRRHFESLLGRQQSIAGIVTA